MRRQETRATSLFRNKQGEGSKEMQKKAKCSSKALGNSKGRNTEKITTGTFMISGASKLSRARGRTIYTHPADWKPRWN